MAVESKIYQVLSASTALAALVGSRIYPILNVQSGELPSVVYSLIPGPRINHYRGRSNLENPHLQIDIYATGIDQLRLIGNAISTVIAVTNIFTGISNNTPVDEYDDDLQFYRRSLEFSIWNKE